MKVYHSALKNEIEIAGELDFYQKGDSIVFAHDVTKGIHQAYQKAKAIYSEPAWRKGYNLFLERAGVGGSVFNDYLTGISRIIYTLNLPTFIVMGKHMLKKLKPDRVVEMKINNGNCILGVWNTSINFNPQTNEDVINYVADNYNNVLDFSCGYGNLAKAIMVRDKKFICSDINKKCVYYIAREMLGYEK